MKKRIVALLLSMVMVLGLTACGGEEASGAEQESEEIFLRQQKKICVMIWMNSVAATIRILISWWNPQSS